MAAVDKWRKVLNEGSFCKTLRENNAAESNRKLLNDAKSLLLVLDNDLFIWDNKSSHLIFYNLNNLTLETNSARHQVKRKWKTLGQSSKSIHLVFYSN